MTDNKVQPKKWYKRKEFWGPVLITDFNGG